MRSKIFKNLSVLAFKILLWSFWYNKHTCIFKIGEEKSGTGNAVLMQFCGHFGLQDGRRASKKFFFTIFQLSSSRPFIWYQICTENPVFRQKVSKPPYLPLRRLKKIKICHENNTNLRYGVILPVFAGLIQSLHVSCSTRPGRYVCSVADGELPEEPERRTRRTRASRRTRTPTAITQRWGGMY